MSNLRRHIVAEIRRLGKQYPDLEEGLPSMTEVQLRDLLSLIREVREQEAGRGKSRLW